MPVCFGGISIERAEENLEKQKKRDRKKHRLCKKHEITLIKWKYNLTITKENVIKKLKQHGLEEWIKNQ